MKKLLCFLGVLTILVSACTIKQNIGLEEYNGTVVKKEDLEDSIMLRLLVPELSEGKALVMIFSGGECALVDCGSSGDFPKLYETLKKFDVNVIDFIVATSNSSASLGGLEKILQNFEVCQVIVSEHMQSTEIYNRIQTAANTNKVALTQACDGTRIYDFKGTVVDVVSSEKYAYTKETDALSLYVVCKNRSIFIEGECDIGAEAKMATQLKNAIKSDIIVIPFSGVMPYQSQYFLEEVSPNYTVIPVYNDVYPSLEVLDRIKDTQVLRTDLNGDIMFITDGNVLKLKTDK